MLNVVKQWRAEKYDRNTKPLKISNWNMELIKIEIMQKSMLKINQFI